jgi:hypothetical protein
LADVNEVPEDCLLVAIEKNEWSLLKEPRDLYRALAGAKFRILYQQLQLLAHSRGADFRLRDLQGLNGQTGGTVCPEAKF